MASTRLLAALFSALVIGIGLAACGGDETTTVTETAAAAGGEEATGDLVTGTGEAADEEIAAPDAEAQEDIDKITSGLEESQQQANADDDDEIIEAGDGVPKLTYGQARENLNQARYCAADVIAGRNTSCAFALNVAYDFFSLGGARRFTSYSPTTGRYYRVRCRLTSPVICRAGNGAIVGILVS
jgi:hypothetical protein